MTRRAHRARHAVQTRRASYAAVPRPLAALTGVSALVVVILGGMWATGYPHTSASRSASATARAGATATLGTDQTATTPVSTSPTTFPPPVPQSPSTTSAPASAYAVIDRSVTYQDPSRPTPARGDAPSTSGRVLRTILREPVGVAGPLPLVIFAPGYNQTPEAYESLLDAWASSGYLVAAVDLPSLAPDLPGTPVETDTANDAVDLSYVTTSLLRDDAAEIDPTRIAVAGHSDGGMAVVTLALDPQYADRRFRSYVVLSSAIPDDVTANWGASRVPGSMLVAVGTADEYQNYPTSIQVYQTATLPRVLVTVDGGDHQDIYLGDSPTGRTMRAAIVQYTNTSLSEGAPSSAHLAGSMGALGGAAGFSVQSAG